MDHVCHLPLCIHNGLQHHISFWFSGSTDLQGLWKTIDLKWVGKDLVEIMCFHAWNQNHFVSILRAVVGSVVAHIPGHTILKSFFQNQELESWKIVQFHELSTFLTCFLSFLMATLLLFDLHLRCSWANLSFPSLLLFILLLFFNLFIF